MSLAFSRDRTTRDIDARIDAGHNRLTEAVRKLGRNPPRRRLADRPGDDRHPTTNGHRLGGAPAGNEAARGARSRRRRRPNPRRTPEADARRRKRYRSTTICPGRAAQDESSTDPERDTEPAKAGRTATLRDRGVCICASMSALAGSFTATPFSSTVPGRFGTYPPTREPSARVRERSRCRFTSAVAGLPSSFITSVSLLAAGLSPSARRPQRPARGPESDPRRPTPG